MCGLERRAQVNLRRCIETFSDDAKTEVNSLLRDKSMEDTCLLSMRRPV